MSRIVASSCNWNSSVCVSVIPVSISSASLLFLVSNYTRLVIVQSIVIHLYYTTQYLPVQKPIVLVDLFYNSFYFRGLRCFIRRIAYDQDFHPNSLPFFWKLYTMNERSVNRIGIVLYNNFVNLWTSGEISFCTNCLFARRKSTMKSKSTLKDLKDVTSVAEVEKITVFSDYLWPFCMIGKVPLDRLIKDKGIEVPAIREKRMKARNSRSNTAKATNITMRCFGRSTGKDLYLDLE